MFIQALSHGIGRKPETAGAAATQNEARHSEGSKGQGGQSRRECCLFDGLCIGLLHRDTVRDRRSMWREGGRKERVKE